MPFPPQQSSDFFDIANTFLSGGSSSGAGFQAQIAPSSSGFGTRQSRVQNNRAGVNTRKLVHWLVPEGPIVQMYLNPQNIRYNYKKAITSTRTKGGYLLQYWGEELTVLNISGTTGTSGIEGINVLYDVYRNEQLAFDPFALFLSSKANQDAQSANVLPGALGDVASLATGGGDNFLGSLLGGAQSTGSQAAENAPSLASMAFCVEMYWSGEVYRGYFTDFTVTERADNLGMFDYDMNFTVTQRRGFRTNYLGWHRSATSGPSNSNPLYGTPYSYSALVQGEGVTPQVEQSNGISGVSDLQIAQNIANIGDRFNKLF